ncbi:hybrid sensor histidine kinase/response regulator transcription factor [Pseudoalteromonas luteoviolacea]|uniref:hybrid sensor histidine kinase/response regulator transcription factor n=1 Tax=Pseudoalteromonas luteoviolacea TaxID=43657 RepID=UPI001B35B2DA|nr:response regulator [Pseudoalteromonas luteoviolacea]MBQ4837338.1 response regulator [Pseudoalteromonas luteoviolacea]
MHSNLITALYVGFLIIFSVLFSSESFGKSDTHLALGVGDGLPGNRVFDIERDHLGFMWIATGQGLARFDGANTVRFFAHKTPNTSQSTRVRDLLFDSQNRLWAVGDQGVGVLGAKSERFEQIEPPQPHPQLNAYSVFESSDGIVWVGARSGLYQFVQNQLNPLTLMLDGRLITPQVLSITEVEQSKMMLATDSGIMLVDTNTLRVEYLLQENGQPTFADKVWRLNNGSIWLSIHGYGLATYEPNERKLDMRYIDENEFDTVGYVFDIQESESKLYAASLNTGLLTLSNGKVEVSNGLPPLLSLYQDQQVKAYGTYSEGVSLLSANHNAIKNRAFTHPSETEQYEINDVIIADESIWLADQLAGVCRYSLEGDFQRCLDTEDLSAQAMAVSPSKHVWISLYKSLVKVEPQSMTVVQQFDFEKYNIPDAIYSIAIQDEQTIWLSHSFDGLTRLNPHTKLIERFHSGNSGLLSDEIHSLVLHKNLLWVATSNGLQAFDVSTQRFELKTELGEGVSNAVYDLFLSPTDFLFVQTESGLRALDLKTQSWKPLPDKLNKLTNTSIVFDETGYAWFASSFGVMGWSPDSSDSKVRYFDKGDGLFTQGYLGSAGTVFERQLVFIAPDGMTLLGPDKLGFSDAMPKVSEFELTFANGQSKRYFHQENLLALPYEHASMRFVLANNNFTSVSKQQFRYKLEGVANTWVDLGKSRVLMIPKLAHGQYNLLLQSTDSDGNWSQNISGFSFTIKTPWYATVWAYCVYALSAILMLYIVYQIRIAALKRIQTALETEVAEQTREISKQNKLLTEKSEALAQAQAQRTLLLKTLSHELMTPVSLIQGPAEQLNRAQQPDERSKMANIVISNAKRLKVLIEQLMRVSNLNQESQLPIVSPTQSLTSFNLSQICLEQIAAFGPMAEQSDITINTNVEDDIHVLARPDQLEQCVSNLLSNAIKYSAVGKTVSLSLSLQGDETEPRCILQVQDEGVGIEPSELDAIFTPEYRTDTGKRQNVGLGIGLSVVKAIADELNGSIDVVSSLGKGSEFSLAFNALPAISGSENEALVSSSRHDLSDKTVLIVDDTPDMLTLLSSIFEHDYKVEVAVDGAQGLEVAKAQLPDLIISDVMMPKLDGFGLLSRIKQDPLTAHIPVILLTANLNEQRELEGLSRQADDYITKPFSVPALELKVRNVFSHYAANAARWHARIEQGDKKAADSLPMLPKFEFKDEPHIYDFLDKLDGVIHERYQNPDITVSELAKEMALSERQLHRKLTAIISMGANEYLRTYRLYQAITPLLHGKSVAVVSELVGFNSASYFSACFKKQYGMTAKSYVQKQRDKHQLKL